VKKIRRWRSWAAIVYGFVAVTLGGFRNTAWSEDVAPPAAAAVAAPNALEQKVNQLDQQVQSLQQQLQTTQQEHSARLTSPGQPTATQNEPAGEATAGRSGFALKSDDGNFILRFQGLIQADGRFYTGSGANAANYSAATAGSVGVSQFLLRRVRPILAGTIYQNFDFFLQPDFGGNAAAIYDAYLDVKPITYFNVRGGKFKQPLGLERLQTDSFLTFAERGLPSDLLAQRDTGVELYGGFFGNALTYQASFTNGVADGGFTPDSDTNNAKDGALRVFALPFKNSGVASLQGLGVGLAGSYTAENTNIPTFKTAAGQTTFFSYNAATSFNGEHSHLAPQANYYWGPLGIYGEYAQSNQVAQLARVKSRLSDDAWQVAASWVLTGEKASYTGVNPTKNFDPHAGTWGAWEVAARVQQLQIDPDTFRLGFANAQTATSRATGYTVGLNWYLNRFVKLVADYEETWFNGGSGTGTTVNDRPIERVFDTRWQIAF
jgi:phosphate-selective porin OprO/OprP